MTRDPHYEDGPRLIGGAELPRVADATETGSWCAARGPSVEVERDGELAVLRNVVICDRPYNHRGNHENRKYDVCWAQKARTYTESFWRRLEAARKAPPKKVEGWAVSIGGRDEVGHVAFASRELVSTPDGREVATQAATPELRARPQLPLAVAWSLGLCDERGRMLSDNHPGARDLSQLRSEAGAASPERCAAADVWGASASVDEGYNPDDASWETQDRVWEEEEAAERFETSARGIRAALK